MKRISTLILGLLLTSVFTLPAFAGTLTTNKFLYKPSLGARGGTEKTTFDAGLDRIDARLGKEIWVGDPNYGATLQDAITAIGAAQAVLRVPVGAHSIATKFTIPANLTLKFEDGAYLDLTLPQTDIQGLSQANPCVVTWTGHGLATGDYVIFSGIKQSLVGPPTWGAQWVDLNHYPYTITKINDNSFSVAVNTSTWAAYDPGTDPGQVSHCLTIKGAIQANPVKIFNYTGTSKLHLAWNYSSALWELRPEWFGAIGDRTTNDLPALNQAVAVARQAWYGVIRLSRLYLITDTLSLNDMSNKMVILRGEGRLQSGLIGSVDGYPVLEIIGSINIHCENFEIIGSSPNVPTVGLMVGRSQVRGNAADLRFYNLGFSGYFQYGEIFNMNAEVGIYDRFYCYTKNPPDPSKIHRAFAMAFTRTNPWGLTPRNAEFSTRPTDSVTNNTVTNSNFAQASGHAATNPAGCAAFVLRDGYGVVFRDNHIQGVAGSTGDIFQLHNFNTVTVDRMFGDQAGHRYDFNVTNDTPGAWCHNVSIRDYMPAGGTGVETFIKSDANVILGRWNVIGAPYSRAIELGNGVYYSQFFDMFNIRSFKTTGGVSYCNFIQIPDSCQYFNLYGTGYGNIIQEYRTGVPTRTYIDGNLAMRGGSDRFYWMERSMHWAVAAPTTGSYAQASVIWNAGATAAGSPGWVCTASGTFGTLNSGNTTGSITSGTTALTVNATTGLSVGDFIDIAGVSGTKRVVNIDQGTKVVTIDTNANATVTGAAVSFHNSPVFKAMANLAS